MHDWNSQPPTCVIVSEKTLIMLTIEIVFSSALRDLVVINKFRIPMMTIDDKIITMVIPLFLDSMFFITANGSKRLWTIP